MTASAPISKPVVRRAAFVVGKEQRRQFLEVLEYVGTFRCFIDAADTYCHRSSMKRDDLRLTDQQLAALSDWVARAERWFVTPVRES